MGAGEWRVMTYTLFLETPTIIVRADTVSRGPLVPAIMNHKAPRQARGIIVEAMRDIRVMNFKYL